MGTGLLQSDVDVAYIAGFFDGEGSIGIYRTGSNIPHLRTQLVQNRTPLSVPMFAALQQRFGGCVSTDASRDGLAMNWQLNSYTACAFLTVIYPFLSLKREQAALAMWWQRRRPLHLVRGPDGRIRPYPTEVTRLDAASELLMKLLKKTSLADVDLPPLLRPTGREVIAALQVSVGYAARCS